MKHKKQYVICNYATSGWVDYVNITTAGPTDIWCTNMPLDCIEGGTPPLFFPDRESAEMIADAAQAMMLAEWENPRMFTIDLRPKPKYKIYAITPWPFPIKNA